jgi:PAS domain S-box-containing protein
VKEQASKKHPAAGAGAAMKAAAREGKLAEQVEAARNRLAGLYQRAGTSPIQQALLDEVWEELSIALEELQVSMDELTVSRQELEAERQHYLELFEFAPAGYLVTDPSGNIREANKVAESMLNCRQEYLVGKPMITFLEEENHGDFFQLLNRLLSEDMGREWCIPLHPRQRAGSFPAALSVSRILDDHARLIGLRWLLRDITERVQAEKALRASEERFRLLVEGARDYAIFMLDPEGIVVSWNAGAEHIEGYWGEEIIGKHFSCFYPQEDLERGKPDRALRVAAAEGRFEDQGWRRRRDGSLFWANVVITALRDETGNLRGFVEVMRDITEHKNTREKIQNNLQCMTALRDINLAVTSTLDLRTVLDLLLEKLDLLFPYPTATTVRLFNPESGRIEHLACRNLNEAEWNARGERLPGPRSKEVLQSRAPLVVRNVQKDPRSLRPAFYAKAGLVSYLGLPLIVKEEVLGILCLFTKEEHEYSAEEIDFLSSVAASVAMVIHNSQLYEQLKKQAVKLEESHLELEERVRERTSQLGAVNQALKAEISERRQVEEKLRDREAQLSSLAKELEQQLIASDRLVSMGELAASIAHEFNNPLQIILGYIQDFLSEMKPSHADHQALTIVEKETLRCSEIIQNLLDFARPAKADLALLDIETIIRNSIQVVMGHLVNSQIKVTMDVQPNLPLISADGNQLVQVLINLFFNAAEAMPGGGTLTVRAAAVFPDQATEEKLLIAVSDTGIGIEPEAMANIFRPFFTTKKKKGMGLGLSICERIIKAHGGEIKVESTCGSGTTFYLHFPLIKTTDYGSAA